MKKYHHSDYGEPDIAVALSKLHGLIDEDTQKLSNKLHDYKLSHNRKTKLLKRVYLVLHLLVKVCSDDGLNLKDISTLCDDIQRELENPLNTRWYNRPVDHFEQKGEK